MILASEPFKAIIAKRETTWSDNLDLDGGPFPIANTSRFTTYESDTVEIQLTGQRNNLNYVLGYYSLKDEAYTSNPQSFFGGGQVLLKITQVMVIVRHFMANLSLLFRIKQMSL